VRRRGARFSPSPDLGRSTGGSLACIDKITGAARRGYPTYGAGLCLSSRLFRRPLHDLDARAPRVSDIGYDHAGGFVLPRRLVELDPVRLELTHKGGVVLHVDAKVVEHAPLGWCLRGISFGEADLCARNINDRSVVTHAGLTAKSLCIPGLCLGNF